MGGVCRRRSAVILVMVDFHNLKNNIQLFNMAATAEMPYFIRPSLNLSNEEKHIAYQEASRAIDANLQDEKNLFLKMVTINCLLKTYLPYFYWTGFYIVDDGKLKVGPYQGTLGCLSIDFSKGVCGKATRTRQTQIVGQVHALAQGSDHIACDPNSQSEIVVPVLDYLGKLLGVFDVDSTLPQSFDVIDQKYLEAILKKHFSNTSLIHNYTF